MDYEILKSLLNTPQPSGKLARWGQPSGKLARWGMDIQELHIKVLHRSGHHNVNY